MMGDFDAWLNVLVVIAALPATYLVFRTSWAQQSVTEALFGAGLISLIISRLTGAYEMFHPYTNLVIEWANLIVLVLILSGLFMKIRMGKPSYSRYPLILIFVPSTILIFYPMILDSEVIKSMLIITFAGGCVLVALMITITRHYAQQKQSVLIAGTTILALSYLIHIGYKVTSDPQWIIFRELFLSFGMITTAIGIFSVSKQTKPTINEI